MAGEAGFQVATAYVSLTIDDADFEASITEKIEAACAVAGATGADVLARSLAEGLASTGDEMSGALLEALAGTGDALASDIGAQLAEGLTGDAAAAGEQLRIALQEASAGSGDTIAAQIEGELSTQLAQAGDNAGQEISHGLESTFASSGLHLGAQLTAGLLASSAATGPAVGAEIGAGIRAALPATAGPAVARLGDALTEGAGGVGDRLATVISGELRTAIGSEAAATAARLNDALLEGTAGVGDALAEQISVEIQPGMASAGALAGGLLKEALLEGASGIGDALGVEIGSGLEASAGAGAGEGASAIEHAMQEVAVVLEAEGEDAGRRYVGGLQRGLSSVNAAWGGMSLEELLGGGAPPDEFVQDPNNPYRTVRQSVLEAEQATAQATAAMRANEDDLLRGTQDFDVQLLATFEEIYRGGQGMSDQLATAMTLAFQGIETDTSGFAASELAIFERFYATLETEGDQAAMELATRMHMLSQSAGAPVDMSANLEQWQALQGKVSSEAQGAAAEIGKVGASAGGATGVLGGLARVMNGPLMQGIMGVSAIAFLPMAISQMIPMVESLAGAVTDGGYAAQVASLAQQQLGQSVQQDSGFLGDNTAATIENILAKSDLNDMAGKLGVSQAQLIEYAAGESDAQSAVSDAYQKTQDSITAYMGIRNANTEAQLTANITLKDEKQALDDLTASTMATINADRDQAQALTAAEQTTQIYTASIQDLVAKMQLQAEQAHMNADAQAAYLMTLTPASRAYTQAIEDQIVALAQNSVTAGINAEALNRSLSPQAQLSEAAIQASLAYQDATTATGAYTNALTALYGQYGQASGAEAAFTTALDGLNGKITSGTDAVDLNTKAGAANFTAFQSAATAAETYAEKVYEQTGSSQAADTALQTMVGKLDDAARQAHLTKDQVQQLNTELFGVPDVKDIQIHLDPTPAEQQMSALSTFIQGEIDSLNAKPINLFLQGEVASVNSTPPNLTGGGHALLPGRALGGPAQAGQPLIVGEQRPEVFVPQSDGWIYPSIDEGRQAVAERPSSGAPVFQFFGTQYPTVEQMAALHRELAMAVGVI